jgi:hypothetical protein
MFGMSSKEFWEDDPKLYWAYRTFYLKKLELKQKEKEEYIKYNSWLNGYASYHAFSIALNNAFSKDVKEYPSYEELFNDGANNGEKDKVLTKKEIDKQVHDEFNAWARF